MPHQHWVDNCSPISCGECAENTGCKLDNMSVCSPDCIELLPDGESPHNDECKHCDAYDMVLRFDDQLEEDRHC